MSDVRMSQDPERVVERLKDVVIEFGLRRATAVTDTHRVIVQEPSIWEDKSELEIEVRELEL